MSNNTQREAMSQLFNRYRGKIAENAVVLDMLPLRLQSRPMMRLCDEAVENFDKYPFDKINRWLGSIQGVLAAVGAVDVDEERDFSRPLLHSFHEGAVASFATTNETLKHKPERIQS